MSSINIVAAKQALAIAETFFGTTDIEYVQDCTRDTGSTAVEVRTITGVIIVAGAAGDWVYSTDGQWAAYQSFKGNHNHTENVLPVLNGVAATVGYYYPKAYADPALASALALKAERTEEPPVLCPECNSANHSDCFTGEG